NAMEPDVDHVFLRF
nr:PDVDHVFLRFamide [Locusta migratoria]